VFGSDDFLVDLLLMHGVVTEDQVAQAREKAETDDEGVIDSLQELHFLEEQQYLMILSSEYGMDTFDFSEYEPPPEIVATIPAEVARRYQVVPVMLNGATLIVALADPTNLETLDSLRYILKRDVDGVIAPKKQIVALLNKFYGGVEDSVESFLEDVTEGTIDIGERTAADMSQQTEADDDAPIVRFVALIISEAYRTRTSDIHLEPLEKRFRIRYRVDGMLHEVDNPPKYLQNNIISRLKIMAQMDITEHRIPQDGRIRISVVGRDLDLRVNVIPTTFGESIVMRILDKSSIQLGIPELGFFADDQELIQKIITMPDGVFLVTGPTGSGKTTSLYAFLNTLNVPTKKIITAEDPVEYDLAGVNQVPIRSDIGFTFVKALRSMLRQAPNIIMVGEIRDLETAEIAINAALTGHLVFSTLHTNDAPGAITRMVDMGIKPFLVASAVRAVMAQRLVRRICKKCAEPTEAKPAELKFLRLPPDYFKDANMMRGRGCSECTKGYKGRLGIYELFMISENIQKLIFQLVSSTVIREAARAEGMRTLRDDALRKTATGVTSLEEVIRVTASDEDPDA
jgi:general secretion pathway protein E/type IV pilus assembly protein PilB